MVIRVVRVSRETRGALFFLSLCAKLENFHMLDYSEIRELNSLSLITLIGYGIKNPLQDGELLVRAPVVGHGPKGLWVVKTIAGGELYVFQASKWLKRKNA